MVGKVSFTDYTLPAPHLKKAVSDSRIRISGDRRSPMGAYGADSADNDTFRFTDSRRDS